MKILVFTDVHGNLSSLQALAETEDFSIADKRIFLGDIVVGCSRPNECIEFLSSLDCECLLGNNDAYVCDHIPQEEYECSRPEKIEQMKYFQNLVTDKNKKLVMNWKKYLTIKAGKLKFYFTHYPWESEEKVVESPFENPSQTYPEMFKNIDADYIFFGHKHRPKALVDGKKHFYLVGTLGLKSPSSYLMIDINKENVKIEERFIQHDINSEIDLMDKAGYPYEKSKIKKQQTTSKNGE